MAASLSSASTLVAVGGGSSYTDTKDRSSASFRALGCTERGRAVWNVEVLNIIRYIVTEIRITVGL